MVQGRSAVFRVSVGLNRVVSNGLEFRAVYVCLGFRFVQRFLGLFWVYGRSALSRV